MKECIYAFITIWTVLGCGITLIYYTDVHPEYLKFSCNCIIRLLLGGLIIWIVSILILCGCLINYLSILLDGIFKPDLDEEKKQHKTKEIDW